MARYEVDGTSARKPDGEEGPFLRLVKNEVTPDISGRSSIKPNSPSKQNQKIINFDDARRQLADREKMAGEGVERGDGVLEEAKKREEDMGGLYAGTGKKAKAESGKNGKGRAKGWFKKGGPMGLVLGLILGIGGIMGGSQLLQPFSLLAQFRESFNSMHVSANTRSNAFFRMQMDSGRVKDPIKGKVFGADTFKITKKQAARLATQGIDYDNDFEGTGIRVLKFDDGTGEIRVVAADGDSLSKLNDAISVKNASPDITTRYNADAITFERLYSENADFFNGYNKGSMTWRGAIANWFGTKTAEFLNSNKITRNLFQDFQRKIAAANDGNTRTVATDMIAKRAEDIEDGGIRLVGADETKSGEGGETETSRVNTSEITPGENNENFRNGDYSTAKNAGYSEVPDSSGSSKIERSKMNYDTVKSKLQSISGTVQKGANIACAALDTIGAVNLLVTASEALQIINLTSAYFEAIDKVKAGDGADSPINELMAALNERGTNTHTEIVSSGEIWNDSDQNSNFIDGGNGGIKTLKTVNDDSTTTYGSAMESSGIIALYSGGKVDVNDPSVKSFNFTSSIKRILGGVGVSMDAFETCAIAKMAANVTSAVADAITAAGCILGIIGAAFTFGVSASACTGFVVNTLVGVALGAAIGVTVTGIISAIIPVVASVVTRNLIAVIGEDLGNALTSGANMYFGNVHRSNGGSLATIAKYANFFMEQVRAVDENAKYERQTKDPFDATSKYTFMGTLLTQLMSFTGATSLTKVITSSSSVVSNSIVAMLPTASAYDVTKSLPDSIEEYADTCPYLASIGAIGDAYCNPYAVTDMATVDEDPLTVIEKISNNFQDESASDGNVKIKGDSDLAKYIIYCDQRESAFGIADQNIVSSLTEWTSVRTGSSGLDTGINSAIGAVPVLGDLIDVMSDATKLENLGYISGESCVAGNTVNNASAPGWDKAKYYQRFIEDQSLAESIGLIEESAVTAFVNEYREEHPLDNSYEGILARYSGLKKDDVVALLDFVEYANYVANYDPSERYVFGAPAVEMEKELRFDNENSVAENVWGVLADAISYADVRNRSFAV